MSNNNNHHDNSRKRKRKSNNDSATSKTVLLQGRDDAVSSLWAWGKEIKTYLQSNFDDNYVAKHPDGLRLATEAATLAPENWTAVMVSDCGYETLKSSRLSSYQHAALADVNVAPSPDQNQSHRRSDIALWMTGRDHFGRSTCIWIERPTPYFYVGISHPDPAVAKDKALSYAEQLCNHLEAMAGRGSRGGSRKPRVLEIRPVKRRWFYGYRPDPVHDKKVPCWTVEDEADEPVPWDGGATQASDWYLKVCVNAPYHVSKMRKWAAAWADGMGNHRRQRRNRWRIPVIRTTSTIMAPVNLVIFEANVEFGLRFMIDRGLVGCGWCVIDESRVKTRAPSLIESSGGQGGTRSRCHRDIVIDGALFEQAERARDRALIQGQDPWEAIRLVLADSPIRFVAREAKLQRFVDGVGVGCLNDPMHLWFEDLRKRTSAMRIMAFDIECCNRRGSFPQADQDDGQVINMAARVYDLDKVEAYERRRPVELALKQAKARLLEFTQSCLGPVGNGLTPGEHEALARDLAQELAGEEEEEQELYELLKGGWEAAGSYGRIDDGDVFALQDFDERIKEFTDKKRGILEQVVVKAEQAVVGLGIDGLGDPRPVLQYQLTQALAKLKVQQQRELRPLAGIMPVVPEECHYNELVLDSDDYVEYLEAELRACEDAVVKATQALQQADPNPQVIDTTLSVWPPPLHAVVMGIGGRDPMGKGVVDGYPVQSFSFSTEDELLVAFAKQILVWDPDVIEGYNSVAFDMAYLLRRAEHLDIHDVFWDLGRLPGRLSKPKQETFGNKARGKTQEWRATIHGRAQFDIYKCCDKDIAYKPRSYKLTNVAHDLLGQRKLDMPYEEIPAHHFGTPATRCKLDQYCDVDALLPFGIDRHQSYLTRYIELARVTGVPLNYLLTKGQQVLVFSQLLREARKDAYAIPWLPVVEPERDISAARNIKAYQGAIVIEPKAGMYSVHKEGVVMVNDYKSLYPMNMISQNLCYTTHVTDRSAAEACRRAHLVRKAAHDAKKLLEDRWWEGDLMLRDYEVKGGWKVAPVNSKTRPDPVFVRPEVRKGLIPRILEALLAARAVAKKAMKQYPKGSPAYKIQDARQMALKVCCNSVYGFTGAPVGRQPDLDISGATTGFGRVALYYAKWLTEELLPGDNEVIYGDTVHNLCFLSFSL